ncbi:MAG TPA: amidohydrolase family protein [Chloroflexi bacterium]|nr:amidohydrolase family protein [Chloroflexota bacterium]
MTTRPNLTIFRNLNLLDGTGRRPVVDAAILVEGNRIRAVGRAAEFGSVLEDASSYDCGGRTVLPGLINAHEHLTWRRGIGGFEDRVVRQPAGKLLVRGFGHALISLLEGVTTVRDVGSKEGLAIALRDAINAGQVHGPRIIAAGAPIAMTGGHGSGAVRVANGVTEVRRAAREQLKAGADLIKLMASGGFVARGVDSPTAPQFTVDEMRVAFDEAHKAGKRTTVHAHPPAAIHAAIEAGVDCIEHAGLADRETAEFLAERKILVVPTLSALRMEVERGERLGRPAWLVEMCRQSLPEQKRMFRALLEAGCMIVAGVDSLGDLQGELGHMVDEGMPVPQAIAAATLVAAQCLGVEDQVGTLETGKMADFIAVDGDPLTDIRALRKVALTVKDGVLYHPDTVRTAIGPGLMTDFR